MGFKKTTLFLSLIPFLYANELNTNNFLNLETLEKKEKSLEKDFYIWQFIEENSTKYQNIIDALGQSSNVNNELFFKYAQNLGHDETLAVAQCMEADEKTLIQTHSDCIKAGLSIKKALNLSPLELDLAISKVQENYPTFAKELKIINSSIPFTKIVSSNKDIIFDIYLNSSDSFLFEKLNYKLPSRTLQKVINDKRFEQLLLKAISNPKLNFLQGTFLDMEDSNLSSNSSFLLAMNRILNKKFDEKTIKYLDNSFSKTLDEEEKEKILFWKYQILKDENYLRSLTESTNINIYTIYANQFLKKDNNLNSMLKTPLDSFLSNCTNEKKIFINSMAKELSNFNKDKIEFLNLGIFQVNLQKAEKISEEYDFIFDYTKLFDIKENLLYFNIQIQKIETEFYHPLFWAISYKNGVENLQINLNRGLFQLNNPYNSYLSMEIYEDESTRKFAKNFLANYINYYKLVKKENITVDTFFEKLMQPLDLLDF